MFHQQYRVNRFTSCVSSIDLSEFNIIPGVSRINGCNYMEYDGYRYGPTKLRPHRGYWRCTGYHRYKCIAKMVTAMLNGWPVAKITYAEHTCMKPV